MLKSNSVHEHPLFPGTPLDAQTHISNTISTNWHYGRNAPIGAPTGVGKSLITKRLIGWLAALGVSAYVVTASTLLEAQYVRDLPDAKQVAFRSSLRDAI
jgi:hypothetical protein